jgi:hypothetical protein
MNFFDLNPEELFYKEIGLIRSRHGKFFPEEQLENIKIEKTDAGYKLNLLEDYDLDEGIGMEIQLAFKLIFC